jgi:hypothetical protein
VLQRIPQRESTRCGSLGSLGWLKRVVRRACRRGRFEPGGTVPVRLDRRRVPIRLTEGQDSYRLAQATAGKGVKPLA